MTLINSFVFFGTKPHFHIQGKSKFPSCLNHLLSVIYICCFFLVFLSYLIKLVSQKNLSIATTIFKDISPLLINISDPNFVFTFGLQYKNYSNFIDETLYHVKGYFIQIYKDENNNTTKTKTPINLVPCSKVYIPVLPNYFNKLPLDQLYCINEKRNLYLEGSISTTNWSYIEFDFSRCRGNDCKIIILELVFLCIMNCGCIFKLFNLKLMIIGPTQVIKRNSIFLRKSSLLFKIIEKYKIYF